MPGFDPTYPPYFLAWALASHPGGAGAEISAHVVAPTLIRPQDLGRDAEQIVAFSAEIAHRTGHRLIFFSQLSAALSSDNDSWSNHGVDWERGLADLQKDGIPGFSFGLYYNDWIVVRGGARQVQLLYQDGPVTLDIHAEQDRLRNDLVPVMYSEWQSFIQPYLR